jgi:hypothetical protein
LGAPVDASLAAWAFSLADGELCLQNEGMTSASAMNHFGFWFYFTRTCRGAGGGL